MKSVIIIAVIGLFVSRVDISTTTTVKDPKQYDCRVVVGYRNEPYAGNKPPRRTAILACPHKEKMAAGKRETSWIWGMRCKE